MNDAQEALEYDSMDHGEVNRQFVCDILSFSQSLGVALGEVLDLGAGSARIPLELCRADPNCRIVAADLSSELLTIAQINIEIAGLTERILLQRSDSKALIFPDGRFEWVISNSLLHHLPDPRLALAEAVRVLRPGGGLFFRDLVRPQSRAELETLVERYVADATATARKMFRDSLHAALDLPEIHALVAGLGFAPETVSLTSDRHWTWRAQTVSPLT